MQIKRITFFIRFFYRCDSYEKAYLAFTGACRTYRKKLLRSDDALGLFDKEYDKVREAVPTTKNALPKTANAEEIEKFNLYCQRERDMLKEFSDKLKDKYVINRSEWK